MEITEDRIKEIYREERVKEVEELQQQKWYEFCAKNPEMLLYSIYKMRKEGGHTPEEVAWLDAHEKAAIEVIDSRPSIFKKIKAWYEKWNQ